MGFGLLFTGYATLLLFRSVPVELIGFFLIYLALEKLETQEHSFRYAKYASMFMFAEAIPASAAWLCNFLKLPVPFFASPVFETAESIVYHAGLLVFHILLLRAMGAISEKVGYTKGKKRARFSLVTTAIFYFAELLATLNSSFARYMTVPLAIFQILWLIVNLVIIYSCYMMIVTDEMLEKEERKYTEYLAKHAPKNKKPETAKNETKKTGEKSQKFKASKK